MSSHKAYMTFAIIGFTIGKTELFCSEVATVIFSRVAAVSDRLLLEKPSFKRSSEFPVQS